MRRRIVDHFGRLHGFVVIALQYARLQLERFSADFARIRLSVCQRNVKEIRAHHFAGVRVDLFQRVVHRAGIVADKPHFILPVTGQPERFLVAVHRHYDRVFLRKDLFVHGVVHDPADHIARSLVDDLNIHGTVAGAPISVRFCGRFDPCAFGHGIHVGAIGFRTMRVCEISRVVIHERIGIRIVFNCCIKEIDQQRLIKMRIGAEENLFAIA